MKFRNFNWVIFIGIIFIVPSTLYAHSGGTASDGCHYCHTNCSKYGYVYGVRHCHQNKGIPQPSEPIRSHRDGTTEIWEPYKTPKQEYSTPSILDSYELPNYNIPYREPLNTVPSNPSTRSDSSIFSSPSIFPSQRSATSNTQESDNTHENNNNFNIAFWVLVAGGTTIWYINKKMRK